MANINVLERFMLERDGVVLNVHPVPKFDKWRAVLTYELSGSYSSTDSTPEEALEGLNRMIARRHYAYIGLGINHPQPMADEERIARSIERSGE